uniref:Uncharacterized protein n=1 Tax=Arundo donax TaxID=35708 RepID=A0A0A8Y5Y0_ARUDO
MEKNLAGSSNASQCPSSSSTRPGATPPNHNSSVSVPRRSSSFAPARTSTNSIHASTHMLRFRDYVSQDLGE